MTVRSFFYIQYLPEKLNPEFLAGRCLRVLHGFMSSRQLNNIGVSFPAWSENSIGSTIAFVSPDNRLLSSLKSQKYFLTMEQEGYFKLSNVQTISSELCSNEDLFYRERQQETLTPAARERAFRRLKSRAEARGETYKSLMSYPGNKVLQKCHSVPLEISSRQIIQFNIGKIDVTAQSEAIFSSYGLGKKDVKIGSVPCLKPFIFNDASIC
ncbi:type I-F CRISPR-associated endoribonuclease Cas6/Csy4 [Alishewanella sp. WH16-1]|uniref:type I-F CRISPR-associated endoribonuclease Cas6/Csy4 n=1 Tax=Alishewanella sp. WH16-1 TaxID=1651088 RepID=UPI0009EA53D7|nr:type I-F CRISPR-associated endoribonuclease Cas6/Csy4 [Alishewanella sp. WH16-1]